MTFATEVARGLSEGRELAEARMLATVAIQYDTGRSAPDPVTLAESVIYVTAFSTTARIKTQTQAIGGREVGGRTASETTRELHIPVGSTDPWADSRAANGVYALVTAADPTDDPTLLGARLTLSGPAPGSQTTARRLKVTEVVQ